MQMRNSTHHIIGIDVGGTNTDTVVIKIEENKLPQIIEKHKVPSQEHFLLSICKALQSVSFSDKVSSVMIGTTFFLNSLIQRKNLSKVCVLRLAGRSGHSVPCFSNWPQDLRRQIEGYVKQDLKGGYFYDGREMESINEEQIRKAVKQALNLGIKSFAVIGVFSPLRKQQQERVRQIIKQLAPQAFVTLSNEIANLGIIERQNATILNASLCPIAHKSINQLKELLPKDMRIFLTQNNGTVISQEQGSKWPIKTFSSGVTNSMIGASFLTGIKDAVVIDIGGTTTDVGIIKGGRPKLQYANIELFDQIRTHMPMPASKSIGIGGGTIVREQKIGPDSLGSRFLTQSLSYGGHTLCLTDVWASLNNQKSFGKTVPKIEKNYAQKILREANRKIVHAIQSLLESEQKIPLIVTGGGSILFDTTQKIDGISDIIEPQNHDVCNAIGSGLCKVSGNIDIIVDMKDYENHDKMQEKIKYKTKQTCKQNGAEKDKIQITDIDEIPLGYIQGSDKRRVSMTAIGKMDVESFSQFQIDRSIIQKTIKMFEENKEVNVQPVKIDYQNKNVKKDLTNKKPKFDTEGRWIIDEIDIEYIAFGAAILGSGGGGDAFLWKNWCIETLRKNPESMKVIQPNKINQKSLMVEIAIAGSPAVSIEYLANGDEFKMIIDTINDQMYPKKIQGVSTAQIGGANGLMGLIAGSMNGLPVVDVDTLGRAFPRLDNAIQYIHKQPCSPTVISSIMGQTIVYRQQYSTPQEVQNFVRNTLINMGCVVGLSFPPLSYQQVQKYSIHNSLSFAWMIGSAKYNNPHNSVGAISQITKGKVAIKQAKIQSVERKTQGGFTLGKAFLTDQSQKKYCVEFQNENLLLKEIESNERVLGITPQIIILVEEGTGVPITTQLLRYGLMVSVLVIPPPRKMASQIALKSVGPQAFGMKQSIKSQHLESIDFPSVWDLK